MRLNCTHVRTSFQVLATALLATWINSNGLKMNVAKINGPVWQSRQKSAQSVCVRISDRELPKQESVKYLGVRIDKNLNWKLHIDEVRKKHLAMIRRGGAYLSYDVRKMLYQSILCSTPP